MSNKTKTTTENISADTQPVVGNKSSASPRTVEASNHFGQVAFSASAEISAELYAILANEGFEGRLVSACAKLDSHKEFGHFGHKGPDGKPVARKEGWKRGQVQFTPERAELVRSTLATSTFPEAVIPVTTSRYTSSAVKAVTVDEAGFIVAKNAIVKRGDNVQELDKLAKLVSFEYAATGELTIENVAFVEKVASFYANL